MSEAKNDEARMTNVVGMTRSDIRAAGDHFVIRHSVIVSSFVIRISSL